MKNRLLPIAWCSQCIYASTNFTYCNHPRVLCVERGWLGGRDFDQFPTIPDWCPLEEVKE